MPRSTRNSGNNSESTQAIPNEVSMDDTLTASEHDGNNVTLELIGNSSCLLDVAEVPSDVINLHDSTNSSADVQVSSLVNVKSTDQSIVKESAQNDETIDVNRKQEQKNVSEYVKELESSSVAPAMDFLRFESCSTVANKGSIASDSDGSEKLNDTSSSNILSSFVSAKADNDDDSDNDTEKNISVNSNVRKECNLDEVEQKFDDDVPHDECIASESEYSDPKDNGSDLGDFIVDDDEVKNEEKEEEDKEQEKNYEEQEEMNDDDKQSEKEDSENEEEDKRVDTTDEERETTKAKVNEYVMVANKESAKSQFSKKLSRLHLPSLMDCSTPKLTSLKHKVKSNIETPKTVEETEESKVELDENQPNTSSKKTKSKNSTTEKNTSLTDIFHQDKRFVERPLNTSLPTDLIKITEKANLSKLTTVSKTPELHKSMRVARSETPTILKCLRLKKEKLNKSAPAKLHEEIDQSKESKDELPITEEKEDVAKTAIKEKNKENVPNLEPSSDNITEEKEDEAKTTIKKKNKKNVPNLEPSSDNITRKRKRLKKHKKQAEETLNENVIDKASSEDTMELEAYRNKKRVKCSESLNVEDDICKGTSEINATKEEKNKKKKLINVNEQCENIKETDIYQNRNVPNLESSNNTTRKRKRKPKKQAEETLNENVIDKASSEDTMELEASRNEKRIKFSEPLTVKDDICKGTSEINETKKKKKKKLVNVSEQCKNIKETDRYHNDNAPNLESSSDNTTRKRKRKHKKQAEETLNETVTDKASSEDTMELEVHRNKKRVTFSEPLTAKDDICKGTSEINETKKKKEKLVNVSEQCENIKETDRYHKENDPYLESSSDNTTRKRKGRRKHKKQVEGTLNKYIIDRAFKKRRGLLSHKKSMASPQSSFNSRKAKNIDVQLSCSGSTTQFTVIKKNTKESAAVA